MTIYIAPLIREYFSVCVCVCVCVCVSPAPFCDSEVGLYSPDLFDGLQFNGQHVFMSLTVLCA